VVGSRLSLSFLSQVRQKLFLDALYNDVSRSRLQWVFDRVLLKLTKLYGIGRGTSEVLVRYGFGLGALWTDISRSAA
jgi:hypothetical protein